MSFVQSSLSKNTKSAKDNKYFGLTLCSLQQHCKLCLNMLQATRNSDIDSYNDTLTYWRGWK
jgi:hypothetical protein